MTGNSTSLVQESENNLGEQKRNDIVPKIASILTGPGPAATAVGTPRPTAAIAKPIIKKKDTNKVASTAPSEANKTAPSEVPAEKTKPVQAEPVLQAPKPITQDSAQNKTKSITVEETKPTPSSSNSTSTTNEESHEDKQSSLKKNEKTVNKTKNVLIDNKMKEDKKEQVHKVAPSNKTLLQLREYPQPDIRGPMPKNAHPDSTFSSHLHNDWTLMQLNKEPNHPEYPTPEQRGPVPENAHPDSNFSSHLHNDWTMV